MENDSIKEIPDRKNYELALLLKNEEDIGEILKLLHQHKIEIRSEGSLKKISLAYEIKKTSQAYFCFFQIFSSPEDAKSLERDLRVSPAVLRSLIMGIPQEKATADAANRKRTRPIRKATESQETRTPSPKPLSNEALEKKIEEILQ